MRLDGKTAVVTGGTAGIGKAIAIAFSEAGADVIIFGTNQERGDKVASDIQGRFVSVDVSNYNQVKEAIQNIGTIDILVNNAGINQDNLLLRMTEEEWDRVIDVNLKSCFNTCKAALRSMIKSKYGKIINISSVVGISGNPGQVNYAASKSGMIGFSKTLAKEVASRNICINCIAPGFIETPMTDRLTENQTKEILDTIPLRRLGKPDDIAQMALFLSSPLSDYITGQVFVVDGGRTI
ncbi:MAG: 3-oxoacyl-[acyl-carrier-protein] reductase [Waddliaceae bacterium]